MRKKEKLESAFNKLKIEPIEKVILNEQIIEKFINLLGSEKLKRGDTLPSERYLSNLLNISRASLREALKALNILGIIEINPGKRTIVSESFSSLLINPLKYLRLIYKISLEEILEFRNLLEVEMVKKAAVRATTKDIEEMVFNLKEAENNINDLDTYTIFSMGFHASIFKASKNRIMAAFMSSVEEIIILFDKYYRSFLRHSDFEKAFEEHYKILDAIKEKSPEKAEKAITEHLKTAEAISKKYLNT